MKLNLLDRTDTRIKTHTEAMRRLLTSFENDDIRAETFTVEMNRQVCGLFSLMVEMKDE